MKTETWTKLVFINYIYSHICIFIEQNASPSSLYIDKQLTKLYTLHSNMDNENNRIIKWLLIFLTVLDTR